MLSKRRSNASSQYEISWYRPLVVKLAPGHDSNKGPDLTSLSDDDLKTLAIQLERTADAIRALALDFAKAKFWELDEDYSGKKCKGNCTDMPTAVTEIRAKGMTHRVKHYYGCGGVPKPLFGLESAIDKSANSEQWTGDVSKAGPFGTTCF